MVKPIDIYRGSQGLNNRVDPERLSQGTSNSPAVIELATAINVLVDDTGLVALRQGTSLIQTGEFHSLFCDGGDCFIIQERASDAALMRVNDDFSLTGVRSGISKGARLSFCQLGSKTFYTNGFQNGVVTEGVSAPWPNERHVGAETVRDFLPAPIGKHIAHHVSRMWISVDNTIWITEPYTVGKLDRVRGFVMLPSDINMLKAVKSGLWVSTVKHGTGFIYTNESASMDTLRWAGKSPYSAHEWSVCTELVDLSQTALQVPGEAAIWSSNAGLCAGSENGEFISITEKTLVYPKGSSGASVAVDRNIINTIY